MIASPLTENKSSSTAIKDALDRIAPLWPLDHFVAVNPFLGLTSRRMPEAAKLLRASHGASPFQSPAEYLTAWKSGAIGPADLAEGADGDDTPVRLVALLEKASFDPAVLPIATVTDLFDRKNPQAHWTRFITDEISKWCGVAFDENQTTWNSPWKNLGLFAAWHQAARHDRNPESYGLAGFRAFVADLPEEAGAAIEVCLALLQPGEVPLADFLHRQLATISGWAGYARYLAREDELRGKSNAVLTDLLAIRLAYDAALLSSVRPSSTLATAWREIPPRPLAGDSPEILARWQDAYEAGYRRHLVKTIAAQPSHLPASRPPVQAIFCIDVRSEVFRRHLEAAQRGLQTIGFAGFFGFPVAHPAAGSPGGESSRCPALLIPPVKSKDRLSPTEANRALRHRAEAGVWKAFQNSATSCFSFVESVGLAFGPALWRGKNSAASACSPAPALSGVSVETRADLAEGALRNMSLIRNFARLVLICGHGSHSANNPYASALACGACGGHAGDLNARLAATTLNEGGVRSILAERGIVIPEDTVFVAGLHDTLGDDVTLFVLEEVPVSHQKDLADLTDALARAGRASRIERAPALGLGGSAAGKLPRLVRDRATDISQVRPEWGLAGNAAIVAAPRSRTSALKLDGRVFLHDYEAATDPDDKVLNLILVAPVVVASWINLQYYASRISPAHFGSGDKTLHHVVGGIGVMEGNQGDLKTGLPLQSIHDGDRFVHEPRRLIVIIEAERTRLDAVLTANPAVRELFDHGWIHLIALEGVAAYRMVAGEWREEMDPV